MLLKFISNDNLRCIMEPILRQLIFSHFKKQLLSNKLPKIECSDKIRNQISFNVAENIHGPVLVPWNSQFNTLFTQLDRDTVQNNPWDDWWKIQIITKAALLEQAECKVENVIVFCWLAAIVSFSGFNLLEHAIICNALSHYQVIHKFWLLNGLRVVTLLWRNLFHLLHI